MMHKADIDKLTHTLIGLLDLLLIPSSFVTFFNGWNGAKKHANDAE
jgi:hypothetical protein